jgi:hypothetical protein
VNFNALLLSLRPAGTLFAGGLCTATLVLALQPSLPCCSTALFAVSCCLGVRPPPLPTTTNTHTPLLHSTYLCLHALCPLYICLTALCWPMLYNHSQHTQINAEKAPYLTDKLKVWMLPTLALIKGEKVVDYVVGFDDLGGKDDFSTGESGAWVGEQYRGHHCARLCSVGGKDSFSTGALGRCRGRVSSGQCFGHHCAGLCSVGGRGHGWVHHLQCSCLCTPCDAFLRGCSLVTEEHGGGGCVPSALRVWQRGTQGKMYAAGNQHGAVVRLGG